MAILVCGGAGYIGSHAVHALAAAGQEVVVVDNLQTGHAAAVAGKAAFVRGDIRDAACLDGIFRRFRIDASCTSPPIPRWARAWSSPSSISTTTWAA